MSAARQVARLTVTLRDVEPAVLRRLDVPVGLRLDRLHLVLQAAMGWTNSHLYAFSAGGTEGGVPDPEFRDGARSAAEATLRGLIGGTGARTIHYLYDFGDSWDHAIRIERITEPEPDRLYPRLVGLQGRCPPEDVGGPPGYAAFLDALADPAHDVKRHGSGTLDRLAKGTPSRAPLAPAPRASEPEAEGRSGPGRRGSGWVRRGS